MPLTEYYKSWAPAEQIVPYSQLTQSEKDKDIAVVLTTAEVIITRI